MNSTTPRSWLCWLPAVVAVLAVLLPSLAAAQDGAQDVAGALGQAAADVADGAAGDAVDETVRLLVLLTSLTFLPALLLMMTPFTRFIIVFALLRQAIGLQQSPPNQVFIGLAFILSMVVMQPTLTQVNDAALQPYLAGDIDTTTAMDEAVSPMRRFMLRNMEREDLATALRISRIERPQGLDDLPTTVVVTGFVLSELRSAFVIGVKVYLPFLVLDIIIASVLLGMGMMMIPPVVISLPFKLMVFVLMDGWNLLVVGLVSSFAP